MDRDEFLKAVDRTQGRLDAAVIAYRNDPTDENHEALMAVGLEHVEAFYQEQTIDFMDRTTKPTKKG